MFLYINIDIQVSTKEYYLLLTYYWLQLKQQLEKICMNEYIKKDVLTGSFNLTQIALSVANLQDLTFVRHQNSFYIMHNFE